MGHLSNSIFLLFNSYQCYLIVIILQYNSNIHFDDIVAMGSNSYMLSIKTDIVFEINNSKDKSHRPRGNASTNSRIKSKMTEIRNDCSWVMIFIELCQHNYLCKSELDVPCVIFYPLHSGVNCICVHNSTLWRKLQVRYFEYVLCELKQRNYARVKSSKTPKYLTCFWAGFSPKDWALE